MVEITEKDYLHLKWRVDTPSDEESCIEKFPELRNIFQEYLSMTTDSLSNDQLIRFIVLCYDRRSPYVEKIDNIMERKVAVLNFLRIPTVGGTFPDDIQSIIKSADSKTAKMVYQFCKFQDSLTYFALVTTVEAYIGMNERLGEEISTAKDSKDTAEVMIKLSKIEERIDTLSDKLFKKDNAMKDFIGSVLVVEGRKKRLIPEDFGE